MDLDGPMGSLIEALYLFRSSHIFLQNIEIVRGDLKICAKKLRCFTYPVQCDCECNTITSETMTFDIGILHISTSL